MSSIYVSQNRFQVTLKPLRIPFPYMFSPLAIQLAHHHIDDTEQRDEVRDLIADANLFQRRDVDKRWSANVVAPGIGLAVRDYIKPELAFGGFDAPIGLACRHANLILRLLRVDRSRGDLLERLL